MQFTLWTSSCSKRIGNLASRAKAKCAIHNTAASPLSPRIAHCVMTALLYTRFCIARDRSQTIAMRSEKRTRGVGGESLLRHKNEARLLGKI